MPLFLLSISHLPFAQTGDSFLREGQAFTVPGESNSAGSFLKPYVPPLPLGHFIAQWESHRGPLSAAGASTLVPGGQEDSCSCPGFPAPMSKGAACASSRTLGLVKYCDSQVNSTVCRTGNPGTANSFTLLIMTQFTIVYCFVGV